MKHEIKKLSERDHIRTRPAMYIGSVDYTKTFEYVLEDEKILYKELEYVPGLIKIINEIIDNSVDVAIKTDFKSSNVISVKITDDTCSVEDNGTGIPVVKNSDGHYLPELCWNHARAGSNFDDTNRTQIGMNGVGSYATACFSTKFIGETDDGRSSYKITIKNGAESFTESVGKTSTQGTKVTFTPDLKMFKLDTISETHQLIIKQRLINLSLNFPLITFKFNGKKINVSTFKKYVNLFSDKAEIIETDNYKIAILPNDDDDFRQFSYVNGLKIPDGGTHIDNLLYGIVNGLRDKLVKKYKTIKPGDIRNKLMMIVFLKDLPNPKFNSQTKEKITNSIGEINKFYGNIDYEKIVSRIMKIPEIIDPITEVYKIKEEFKRRQELSSLNKPQKKIKSDKYLPSIKRRKILIITEGASATGGLLPVLGRDDIGYFELKGKPLNAIKASQKDFLSNIELTELYKIIQNEGYEKILIGSDQDLDGYHIRGLIIGFISKYVPEYIGRFGTLNTPVIGIKKNNRLVKWSYSIENDLKPKSGEVSKYYKGLGSWKESDLKEIVQHDGFDNMVTMFEFDDTNIITDWLSTDEAESRKEYIMDNSFNIAIL